MPSGPLNPPGGRVVRKTCAGLALGCAALVGAPVGPAGAGDAAWLAAPATNQVLDGANWTGGSVPTGIATFGASATTDLVLNGFMPVAGWTFESGAPAYSVGIIGILQFNGPGIVNGATPVSLTVTGGFLDFRGMSTAGSATITSNSFIRFFDTSTAGSAAITSNAFTQFHDTSTAGNATITNNAFTEFRDSSTAGSATIISNGGFVQFAGASTAGNATITSKSFLQFYGTSTAGNATITSDSGFVQFNEASTAGNAAITINGGFLQFHDTSTAGNATITNNIFLQFHDASTAGNAAITNNMFMEVSGTSTAGSATITNNGSMQFFESSTAGSSTVTNNGGMQFVGSSTAGNATITNNANVFFQQNSTAGNATITNHGEVNFAGASTAGNATITNSGNLFFQQGSTAGSAVITNSATGLILVLDGATTGNATITSAGQIGLLSTDMAGAATVTVQAGGSLSGNGSVGNTTIEAGGILAAVNGTLRVNGNLGLGAGATYRFGTSGLADVTGTAALAGTFEVNGTLLPTWQVQNFGVLQAAGGVTGQFATLSGLPASLAHLVYGPNDVTLVIEAFKAATALGGAGGQNAANVAAGIDAGVAASGPPPAAFNVLLGQSGATLAATLNRLSGEAGTGGQATAFGSASTFLGLMLDPMAGARGATATAPGSSLVEMADTAMARTPAERVEAGWSVWTKAYGAAGRTASDAATGAAGTASSLYGVAAGADRLVAPGTLVGFALAGGGTAFGLGNRGSGTGEYFQAGLYGSSRLGPGYVSAALAYGWNRFDVTRATGGVETYLSSPVAHTFGGRIEAGRRFGERALAVTPYAALEAIGYAAPSYRETWVAPATGAFALAYGARTTGTLRTEIGLRVDAMRAVAPTADLLTYGRIAYSYQTHTQRAADAAFQQLANSGFTVFGARASTHTMLATLGAEIRLANGTRATASLDGELGDRHRSIRANVGLSHRW